MPNGKIILIGGAGCSGKTALARRLLTHYSIPYFSLDYLMMGLYRGNRCSFSPEDDDYAIGTQIWPIVDGMMKTAIENKNSMVFEGIQLAPHLMASFDPEYSEQCIKLCIGLSESYIQLNFNKAIQTYRSIAEIRDFDEKMDAMIRKHNRIKHDCEENGIAHFRVTDNFLETQQKVWRYIEQRYR